MKRVDVDTDSGELSASTTSNTTLPHLEATDAEGALNENERRRRKEERKQIWDTLHLAHEGVDKVRKARIDLLMSKLNWFVILDREGPQEMFDRLMTMVGEIRGYGCDELDDHKVVKIMLEAY